MITQMERRGFRTVNIDLELYRRISLIKAKYPEKFRKLSDVIKNALDQNKKLKTKIKGFENGSNNKNNPKE